MARIENETEFEIRCRIEGSDIRYADTDERVDIQHALELSCIPAGDYSIEIVVEKEGDLGYGLEIKKSRTKLNLNASWHDEQLKNHPGDLGDWWSNDIICLVDIEREIYELRMPQGDFRINIKFKRDDD
jgi:hypothetical protein